MVRVEEAEEALNAAELPAVGARRTLLVGRVPEPGMTGGLPVVLLPRAPGDDVPDLLDAVGLAGAGVPMAFGTGEAAPTSLRLQALMALSLGADPGRVRDALHGGPYAAGSLVGAPADLVVWSGDPLNGHSRALAVIVDGKLLHEAPERGGGSE